MGSPSKDCWDWGAHWARSGNVRQARVRRVRWGRWVWVFCVAIALNLLAHPLAYSLAYSLAHPLAPSSPRAIATPPATSLPDRLSYQSGQAEAKATINPLMRRVLSQTLRREIPSALQLEATDLAGAFSLGEVGGLLAVPAGAVQAGTPHDGAGRSVTVDASAVLARLTPGMEAVLRGLGDRSPLPPGLTVAQLNQIFHYQFKGRVELSPVVLPQPLRPAQPTPTASFEFVYDSQSQGFQLRGLDPNGASVCRWQICQGAIASQFEVDLSTAGLLSVSETLGLALPGGVERLLRLAQMRQGSTFDFAEGSLTGALETRPEWSGQGLGQGLDQPWGPRSGHFALHAQSSALPWSLLFSLP